MKNFVKIASVVLVLAMAVTFVSVSKAQTTADLQAQIAALLAQIQTLQSQLSSQGGSTTGSSSYTYSSNLTVGSKGAEVTALQSFLNGKGFLSVAPTGYFGPMTKAALAKYQASVGISPASGFFGPITRANLNSMVAVNPTPTPSTTPTGSSTPTPMPSTGVEGILTVMQNPTPANGQNLYEGDTADNVAGFEFQAQNSPITIDRIQLQLGNGSSNDILTYTKILSSLSVVSDSGATLATVPLNSSTVTKQGSNYYVYLTGLNYVVPADGQYHVLYVKAALYSTIDSAYAVGGTSYPTGGWVITVPVNAVRGTDGAGIQQYGPLATWNTTFNAKKSLSTTATLSVSRDPNSPLSSAIVSDTQGNVSAAPLFAFDLKTDNDVAKVDQAVVNFAGTATPTVAYLYDGSNLLQSASVNASTGYATFTNMMNGFQVPANSTKVITVKGDFSNAGNNASSTVVTVNTPGLVAYKSDGTTYTGSSLSGSGTSDTFYVMKVAPTFALTSANATYTAGTYAGATGTMTGTFTFNVTANGADIYLASSTLNAFQISLGGATTAAVASSSVSYQDPTGYNQVSGFYDIPKGSTATFTVNATALHPGTAANVGSTYMYMSGVAWNTSASSTGLSNSSYMSNIFKTPYVSVQ